MGTLQPPGHQNITADMDPIHCWCCSVSQSCLFAVPWTTERQASLSFTFFFSLSFTLSQSLFSLLSIEPMMWSNDLIHCHPPFLPPSIFPSVFSNESALHIRWANYWSFSISPSNEYLELISLGLISLLCKGLSRVFSSTNSSKASILQCSAFFMVQLSHPYMTTG